MERQQIQALQQASQTQVITSQQTMQQMSQGSVVNSLKTISQGSIIQNVQQIQPMPTSYSHYQQRTVINQPTISGHQVYYRNVNLPPQAIRNVSPPQSMRIS